MLTNAVAKAATPQAAAYKLFDQNGLFLHVAPSGTKSWRLKFRIRGREQLMVLGRFPDMALPIARARRDAVREQLGRGIDPRGRVDIKVNTFAAVTRAWHVHMTPRWSAAHAADVLAGFERDIFPAIGDLAIDVIAPRDLLELLRQIERRGARASAKRIRQRLSSVFGYAISEGHCESDPAEKLGAALSGSGLVRPQPALTAIADCRALLEACECVAPGSVVNLASRFLALTAVRLDAVRGARWGEFEDLDGPAPLWRVPPTRMKLALAKKAEDRFAHLVPLSPAAVAVLREASLNFASSFEAEKMDSLVFPGRSIDVPIGENALRDLYTKAGFTGRHVPHGWRSSFSTILNEQLGEAWRADIDRALAHAGKDKVEAAYNRSQLLERRRELFGIWADLITSQADSRIDLPA